MTHFPSPDMPPRMGRPSLNVKETKVRLSEEARRRIAALVGENRMAAFIRDAVEEKLRRDERRQSGKGAPEGEQA